MRGPLTVRIDDGVTHRSVTRHVNGLRFKRSAWGGDVDLTCTVALPRGAFHDLDADDTIMVDDARTAETAWSGDLEHPGDTSGPGGQALDMQAFGGAVRLQSKRVPLAPVHQADQDWQRDSNSTKGARTNSEQFPDGEPNLEVSWDKGFGVDRFDLGEWVLRAYAQAGLRVGRVRADVDAGVTTADYVQRIMTGPTVAALTSAAARTASTTAGAIAATVGAGIGADSDIIALRAIRAGADVTATKDHWFRFWRVIVRQLLKDRHGADITAPSFYEGNRVLASWVIEDMIGRGMCPGLDPAKVTIQETGYLIDSLSWLDGITMGDALAELKVLEPDMWWTVYGDTGQFGLWDDENPRYVVSDRDGGIVLPGPDITRCNRVVVEWVDRRGRQQTTVVLAADAPAGERGVRSEVLAGLAYVRDTDPVQLPEGTGTQANAERAGAQILAYRNDPPRAGTAVIRRPILDLWAGAMVYPHEHMPACAVLHQETGVTYRLTEVEYVDGDAASAWTLGEPVVDEAQRLARLERKAKRRR